VRAPRLRLLIKRRVELRLCAPPPPGAAASAAPAWHALELELAHAVVPAKCAHRLTPEKNRVTLILRKADGGQDWAALTARR
jgi:hypothetical protein